MKRFLSLIFCMLLICALFSGCQTAESGKVVVCFDIGTGYDEFDYNQGSVDKFLNWIDDCNKYLGLGISSEDIEVDVIPGPEVDLAARSAALQRIRTEIMSGEGPDVFICRTPSNFASIRGFKDEDETIDGMRLFPYVEKSREEGLFLPLDEMLSDLTLTDTDDLIPQLLEGGKNKAGEQVVIPLTFTVPGVVFSGTTSNPIYGNEVPEVQYEGTSWDDVLRGDDPLLSELSIWAMDYYRFDENYIRTGGHASALFCLFPETADFKNEVPALSEEELFELVKDAIEGCRRARNREPEQYSASVFFERRNLTSGDAWAIPRNGSNAYTLVPMRNLQGGSTAMVMSYCAVNANTRKKEKAMEVIDALLTKDFQKNALLFNFVGGMPNSRTLASPGNPYLTDRTRGGPLEFTAEKYAQWQRICEDINIVRFPSALDNQLDLMMMEIEDAMYTYRNPYSGIIMRDGQFLQGSLSDEELREIISKHYQQMQRLLDES